MIKKFQLKNGLTVLLVESHKSPVVSVQMWVRTGSADEQPKLRGISHFIEHLVFKGTEKYGVGEIAATVEGSGGELNAYTSFDQTVFYVTISKHFMDTGLDVISQMMGRPSFVEDEIDNEREVVIEEIKRSLDSPQRQASRLLFETLYKKHPYGQPVIGFENIIRNVSRRQIVKYFSDRYCARNMTLLLVGDFEIQGIRPKLESYFGVLDSRRVSKVKRLKEPTRKKPRVAVRGGNFKENFLFLTWPTPAADHADIPALEVLAMIFGQGESSRLNQALRLDRNLVNYAGSSIFSPQDPGFFSVSASLPPGGFSSALLEIQNQWGRLLREPVTADELAKAVVNLHSEGYYSLETVDGMARRYGHFEHLFGDYRESEKFLKRTRALTAEDLRAVAKKYLRPETLSVCAQTPQIEADPRRAEILSWLKNQKPRIAVKKIAAKTPKPKLPKNWFPAVPPRAKADLCERVELKNGTTLILRPNFDTPVVNLRMAMLGGSRLEPKALKGMNELFSRSWVSATQNRNEMELMKAIDSRAGHLSAFGGRNSAGLVLTALKPYSSELIDLVGEVLLEPDFRPDAVEREKGLMMEQLRLRQDNPAQLAILGFNEAMFGDHPYGRDPLGAPETLKNIGVKNLVEHLSVMRQACNITVSVAGHFERDRILERIQALTDPLPPGAKQLKLQPLGHLTKAGRRFLKSSKEQVHLVLGHRGLKMTDPDRFALHILEAILAGQGGRLFIELRDKNSLAYSVAPLRMEGLECGYFGAYIGCSPEKGSKALQMLRDELGRTGHEKVKAGELDRAKRNLIGRHDIDLQKNSAMAAALLFDDIYGLDYQETFRYGDRVRAVSSEDVLNVAQKILRSPEVLSAVGPTEPWVGAENRLEAAP